MPSFLLCISQSLILFDSLRWGGGCFGEKKKLNCKNYHFQELCFSKVSNVRSISESFGKPHLSLILTNQGLSIMVRGRTVINIVPLWWHCPCVNPEGDRGSGHSPWKKTTMYMCFYRNLHLDTPHGKKHGPPPPPPPPPKIMDRLWILCKV